MSINECSLYNFDKYDFAESNVSLKCNLTVRCSLKHDLCEMAHKGKELDQCQETNGQEPVSTPGI